jgi:hypothetical protein
MLKTSITDIFVRFSTFISINHKMNITKSIFKYFNYATKYSG